MENLHIEGTLKSPQLHFDKDKGELNIRGRSLPEHAINVYQPAFDWLDEYAKAAKPQTTINVALEYFNTSSSKLIFDLFRKFEKLHEAGHKVKVNWYYEEDDFDLKEEGELFKELIKIPIELVKIAEFDFSFMNK